MIAVVTRAWTITAERVALTTVRPGAYVSTAR